MIRAKLDQVEQRPGHGLGLNELGNSSAPDGTTATARLKVACVMCPGRQKGGPHVTNRVTVVVLGGSGERSAQRWGRWRPRWYPRAWNPCTLSVWISHRDRDWFQSALLAAVGPVRVRNSTGFSHTTGPGRDRRQMAKCSCRK